MTKLCKYMHNGLYGKFGQLGFHTDITDQDTGNRYLREDILDAVTGRMETITHFMNMRIIQYQEGEGKNSNVAIAAHITENARLVLWEIINQVGTDRVLYCDTDSVKIRLADIDRVAWEIDETKLGALKIEDQTDTLIIEGSKQYRTDTQRRIKGVPHAAKEISPGVFVYNTFDRQTTHLRGGVDTGAKMHQVTKTLKHVYDKGTVLPGGRVIPLHL